MEPPPFSKGRGVPYGNAGVWPRATARRCLSTHPRALSKPPPRTAGHIQTLRDSGGSGVCVKQANGLLHKLPRHNPARMPDCGAPRAALYTARAAFYAPRTAFYTAWGALYAARGFFS
jgi:hypothetical protein